MAQGVACDIADVIDSGKFRAFNWNLLILTFLLLMSDGYDGSALAFSAPALVKAWNIPIVQLGPVLSASVFGILVGAPLFGYLGDRFGRKPAMIAATVTFGLLSLITTQATSVAEVFPLRILTGLGLGGLYPLSIAINTEFAPKRVRATLVTLMAVAASVGGALAGPVAAWLIPQYGWQVMFWIGGFAPFLMAAYAIFSMPESIKYLVIKERSKKEIADALKRVNPSIVVTESTRFIVAGERNITKIPVAELFSKDWIFLTTLLWIVFILVGMSFLFFGQWLVTILTQAGLPVQRAAIAGSIYQLGGAAGAIALCRPMDRRGLTPILWLFWLSVPSVLALALPGMPASVLFPVAFMVGFCMLGLKSTINTAAGMVYPTAMRSTGVGLAVGVGAIGSIAAINGAGILVHAGVTFDQIFALVAVLMVISSITWIMIMRSHDARERADAESPPGSNAVAAK